MIQDCWAASHERKRRRAVWGNKLRGGANWCACTEAVRAVLISHQHKRASAPKPIRCFLLWLTRKCVSWSVQNTLVHLLDSTEESPSLKCSLLQSGWENKYALGELMSPELLLTKCFTWFSKALKKKQPFVSILMFYLDTLSLSVQLGLHVPFSFPHHIT